jgi:outer membrane autotransporter protein
MDSLRLNGPRLDLHGALSQSRDGRKGISMKRRARDQRLLLGVSAFVLLGLPSVWSETAMAACTPWNPTAGQTVVCDGSAPNPDDRGVQPTGNGVTVTINPDATITHPNTGVQVFNDSTVSNNGTILPSNPNAALVQGVGIQASGNNNTLTNNGRIQATAGSTATPDSSVGGIASRGNNNTQTNSATGLITTTGPNANGMGVYGADNISINDGTIITFGEGIFEEGATPLGMDATGERNVVTNNGTIDTRGFLGAGLNAFGNTNTLNNTSSVTTRGDDAMGFVAIGDSNTANNSGTVTTAGARSFGVQFLGDSNTLSNTGTITTTADATAGVNIDGGANAVFNDGRIEAVGVEAAGIEVLSNADETNSIVNLAAGVISSEQGLAISGGFGSDTVDNAGTLLSPGLGSPGALAIVNLDAGNDTLILRSTSVFQGGLNGGEQSDTLSFDGFAFTGASELMNWETLNLTNGSNLTLNNNLVMGDLGFSFPATNTGVVNIDATSTLSAFADRSILADDPASNVVVSNAGRINLSDGTVGNRLTIVGDYVGQGGQLVLDTVLDADGPSDQLVIDRGSATGNTAIVVNNAGGLGALTTGDGILVVDAINGGTTTTDAFQLAGPVVAGAWDYNLFRSGSTDAQDWFLRTQADTPPPGGNPPPVDPRVEVPPYTSVPNLAYQYGFTMLGTYRERFAEIAPAPKAVPAQPATVYCKDPSQNFQCPISPDQNAVYADAQSDYDRYGAWGRLLGATGTHAPGPFAEEGPTFDYNMVGFQAGTDLLRREGESGDRDIAGLYVGTGYIDASVAGINGGKAGESSLNGYTLGGYWTHIGAAGWYIDAVAQGTWYDNVKAASVRGIGVETDGWGSTVSLEGGYPFQLGGGWTLEPQAQIAWQHVELDSASDIGAIVSWNNSDAYLGRVGGRLAKSFDLSGEANAPRPLTVWAQANLLRTFGDDPTTTLTNLQGTNPTVFKTTLGGTWAQLGLGASAQLAQNVAMFGSGEYGFSVDDGDSEAWTGRVGLKVTW